MTRLGAYPTPCRGALDPNGTMTFQSSSGSDDTVVEVPLDGTASTIYSEANATPQDFTRYPPEVYLKIHISDVVGGN